MLEDRTITIVFQEIAKAEPCYQTFLNYRNGEKLNEKAAVFRLVAFFSFNARALPVHTTKG